MQKLAPSFMRVIHTRSLIMKMECSRIQATALKQMSRKDIKKCIED